MSDIKVVLHWYKCYVFKTIGCQIVMICRVYFMMSFALRPLSLFTKNIIEKLYGCNITNIKITCYSRA